jgi:secondary thiamine-phosphate synthase enzyme
MIELSVSTPTREALVDITERVRAMLPSLGENFTGVVNVFSPHTTAAVTINEGADPSVARDLIDSLARLVPRISGYLHAEGNSDAHVKTALIGNSVSVPVEGGRLRLGTWQSIYLAEFDGPRTRRVWITPTSG